MVCQGVKRRGWRGRGVERSARGIIGVLSVHDNLVYAKIVDYEACRIILHTVYPHSDPPEFTDIVFSGVVAHHIEHEAFRGGGLSANVVFDAEESSAAYVLCRYAQLLAAAKKYGWPVLEYTDVADLAARLTNGGAKCFEVHSSCGLSGFVFAASMEFRRRPSRAEFASAEPGPAPDRGDR
jgi:hypothetical protein